MERNVELGLGLIGIGREWPVNSGVMPPSEAEVQDFLEYAFDLGIRFYDTANSYGLSEARFGKFLKTLTPRQLSSVTIATKFGEHWKPEDGTTYSDHSYDPLMRSLDQSLHLLPKIDLLQVHKCSMEALANPGLHQALIKAREYGIPHLGVSVGDVDTAQIVAISDMFDYIQFPFNQDNQSLAEIFAMAKRVGCRVLINRPFNTGKAMTEPFKFVLEQDFKGVVLTGTKSKDHLQENWQSFEKAKQEK